MKFLNYEQAQFSLVEIDIIRTSCVQPWSWWRSAGSLFQVSGWWSSLCYANSQNVVWCLVTSLHMIRVQKHFESSTYTPIMQFINILIHLGQGRSLILPVQLSRLSSPPQSTNWQTWTTVSRPNHRESSWSEQHSYQEEQGALMKDIHLGKFGNSSYSCFQGLLSRISILHFCVLNPSPNYPESPM